MSGAVQLLALDPPWSWKAYSPKGEGKSPSQHYATLTFDDLCALPIKDMLAKDAVVALWVTAPILLYRHHGHVALDQLFDAWGVTYSTTLFTWIKQTKLPQAGPTLFANGHGLHTGCGYASRSNAEFMLLARRGKGLPRASKRVHSVLVAPVARHSEKPDEAYFRLENLYGNVERVELFGRKSRPGWTVTGLDYDGLDVRTFLSTVGATSVHAPLPRAVDKGLFYGA